MFTSDQKPVVRCDFHTHSRFSDGQLSPQALAEKLALCGVNQWALTDHDTVSGLATAQAAAQQYDIQFVPGVEVSVTHKKKLLHIVGLRIDSADHNLLEGLEKNQRLRDQRAERIGEKLEKAGLPGALEGARRLAGSPLITRTEFARWLVEQEVVKTLDEAFKRYLKQGKQGYVATEWIGLEEAIALIHGAGGVAVLAHPLKYKMTASWLKRILTDFKAAGGDAMEIISGQTASHQIKEMSVLAQQFELKGSLGSDFHSEDQTWLKLGEMPELPRNVEPVWHHFETR